MQLTKDDFLTAFGIGEEELPKTCAEMIGSLNFTYRMVEGREYEHEVLEAIKRIDNDKQIIAAPERTEVWRDGWQENLDDFRRSKYNLETLIPKFYKEDIPLRLNQAFIKSDNARFEYDWFTVFRRWIFESYFNTADEVYEFGCGTGYNLVELAMMYPEKKLNGLDFVPSVVELLSEIKKEKGLNINGTLFDMIHPDYSMQVSSNAAFYTFGAIEQLGSQIEDLFKFFLEKKPRVVVHMEPTIELYDDGNLLDYLAIKFHKKRGYTQGLLPLLQEYERNGKVVIEKVKRMFFGNWNMEGYTVIIWRPTVG